jgi:hypothetical protein
MIKGTSINYIGEGGLQRRIILQGIRGRARVYSLIKFEGTKRVDGVDEVEFWVGNKKNFSQRERENDNPSDFAKYLFCQKYTKKILTFRFI